MAAAPGRSLADFDAGDDQPDLAELTGIISPRGATSTPTRDPSGDESGTRRQTGGDAASTARGTVPAGPTPGEDESAPVGGTAEVEKVKTGDRKPQTKPRTRRGPGRPRKPKSQESTGGRRSTTFQLSSDIKTKMRTAGPKLGLSTGDLIVAAIEATADNIGDEIAKEGGFAGGGRFAARRTHQAALEHRESSLVNARLLEADFVTIDEIVEETGARSRNHLVETALRLYLSDK